ncbi:hypothetical protein NHJ13734_006495 [Beauveria thailandica]
MDFQAVIQRVGVEVLVAENPTHYGYHHGPIYPSDIAVISSVNTKVCDLVVTSYGEMCGKSYSMNSELFRHMREEHPNFLITLPHRAPRTTDEKRLGRNAIKRWVLDGGWRRARYFNEPQRLNPDLLIMQYADCFELLARRSEEFRASFGAEFHRPYLTQASWYSARV